uniref:putative tripartite motif-containing protein 75 n=1 Tax=Jaculus jaculus TaxID=51337 RepID=UPI001E1B0D66|nr:putative tripartite motif-containing protein 75 [Jaculus jaculus]
MALQAALESFHAETKCPVCLEELTDPVTVECGHNFCRCCIQQSWAGLEGRFPCPVCRHQCKEPHLQSNGQLRRIAEITRRLPGGSSGKRPRPGRTCCDPHGQDLSLFCEDDLEMLCPQCAQAPEHGGHRLSPVAEAASHHRRKLRGLVGPLKRQLEEVQKLMSEQSKQPSALRQQMERQRQKLSSELEHLNRFLELQQQTAVSRLAEEEEILREKLSKNIEAFSNYGSTLKSLLGKIVQHRAISDTELITEVKNFYKKCDSEMSPSILSVQLKTDTCNFPPLCSALQILIKEFREEVILDPETAHPNLVVSEDKTCVKFSKRKQRLSNCSKRFTVNPVVLGLPYFSSGRHFWEVKVGDKPEWAIGVGRACLSRRVRQASTPQGCWRLLLSSEGYQAPGADPAPLRLEVKARRIGVLLDYELGQLSFYDMPESLHICTLGDTFTEPLQPYFYVGPHSKPIQICTAMD